MAIRPESWMVTVGRAVIEATVLALPAFALSAASRYAAIRGSADGDALGSDRDFRSSLNRSVRSAAWRIIREQEGVVEELRG